MSTTIKHAERALAPAESFVPRHIGPTDADDWVNRHGNKFGLCQTLANEIWHFELATTPGGTCPPPQASSDG